MNIVKLWLIQPKRKIIWTSIVFFCVCALVHNALRLPFFFFFFSFFSFSTGFWTDCLKRFSKHFIINYQGTVGPRSDSFLDTLKGLSVKSVPQVVIRDSCATWHKIAKRGTRWLPTFCWSIWSWWWSGYIHTDLPSMNKIVSTNQ